MKSARNITILIMFAFMFLLSACNGSWGNCPHGPVDYTGRMTDPIVVLCEPNDLCGKKRNLDWDKEGKTLIVGKRPLFFQINEKDTLPLGIENNKFYLVSDALGNFSFPVLYSDYGSTTESFRIALKDDITSEERDNIYRILSNATHSDLAIEGKIHFYKSESDLYFESRYDYLPELIISSSEDIYIFESY
jgi:hypothetical protein